jgi:hypothetical protein
MQDACHCVLVGRSRIFRYRDAGSVWHNGGGRCSGVLRKSIGRSKGGEGFAKNARAATASLAPHHCHNQDLVTNERFEPSISTTIFTP